MFGFHPHQVEEMEFSDSRADRFDGFDRGDAGCYDYEAINAEAEADYQAFLAAKGA